MSAESEGAAVGKNDPEDSPVSGHASAGGPAPLIATALFVAYHSRVPIALYIPACAIITIVATAMMPDYTGRDSHEEYHHTM